METDTTALAGKLEMLWPYPQHLEITGTFPAPKAIRADNLPDWAMDDLRDGGFSLRDDAPFTLRFHTPESELPREGYELTLGEKEALLSFSTEAGKRYGLVTLAQIITLFSRSAAWPRLRIADAPAIPHRAFMVDLGRSIWSLEMLRKLLRQLMRLKINLLHLHLIDDELCGVRFPTLPFGSENPYAIPLAELGPLIEEAAGYGIKVLLEVETWGHVASLVYHYPELRGGPGMYGGSSFLICEATFDLVRKMLVELVDTVPQTRYLHLGLDEAQWFPGADLPPGFTPCDMIARYTSMVKEIGEQRGRDFQLFAYADHAGRELPSGSDLILQPWNYWIRNRKAIEKNVAAYAGSGRKWFPMAGQSMGHHRGAYEATRLWCRLAAGTGRLWGIDIAFWGRNDLRERFITLFAGAQFAWNPHPATGIADEEDHETFDLKVHPIMHHHQTCCRDLSPHAWQAVELPYVYRGYFMWNRRHGKPVAPTAPYAATMADQAFHLEGTAEEK
ncbi:MAG TPA: family 20 glycosylhydrolase [Chthoniobacteraceae bacterium]|nr:family 20 glycosylhydrolase [Chthoniobacteraceae bacterium]